MKGKKLLLASIISLSTLALTIPAQADPLRSDNGLSLDLGGKIETGTANLGMGWGGMLNYMFPDSAISLGIGAQWYGMNSLPSGVTGSVVEMPVQAAYHFSNLFSSPDIDPYAYVGNDTRFISATANGFTASRTVAFNPTFGIGARWFFTPNFGIHATVGGRVAMDGPAEAQFTTRVGTSFRF